LKGGSGNPLLISKTKRAADRSASKEGKGRGGGKKERKDECGGKRERGAFARGGRAEIPASASSKGAKEEGGRVVEGELKLG